MEEYKLNCKLRVFKKYHEIELTEKDFSCILYKKKIADMISACVNIKMYSSYFKLDTLIYGCDVLVIINNTLILLDKDYLQDILLLMDKYDDCRYDLEKVYYDLNDIEDDDCGEFYIEANYDYNNDEIPY